MWFSGYQQYYVCLNCPAPGEDVGPSPGTALQVDTCPCAPRFGIKDSTFHHSILYGETQAIEEAASVSHTAVSSHVCNVQTR